MTETKTIFGFWCGGIEGRRGKLRCGTTDAADGDDDASMRSITSTQDGWMDVGVAAAQFDFPARQAPSDLKHFSSS